MFIYVIVCSETLKLYVGQHKKPDLGKYLSRKFWDANNHTSGTRSYLYHAMRKHPRESWSIHPLASGIESREELDALEQHFIRVLKTQHPDVGYNLCRGGEGFTGPHTKEWRRETLARVKKYWANPNSRAKRAEKMKQQWLNPEFRQMMIEKAAQRTYPGRVLSDAHKKKISEGVRKARALE